MLALVEADGIFEGRQRVRLPVMDDPRSFQDALLRKVLEREVTVKTDDVVVQIYDTKTQEFQTLLQVPGNLSSCRLRITLRQSHDNEKAMTPSQEECDSQQFLALPWKEFDVNLSDGSFLVNGRPMRIQEVTNSGQGTGLNAWDGSIALTKYLEINAKEYIQGKVVLEVGAGTGLVGIAAAMMGARQVIVTDLEYSIANLKENIALNSQHLRAVDDSDKSVPVEAMILDWFKPDACELWKRDDICSDRGTIDTILASDVVWIDSLVLPLVHTLEYICTQTVKKGKIPPLILMSYQCRSTLTEQLLLNTLKGFSFEIYHTSKEEIKSERIQIFRITYKV